MCFPGASFWTAVHAASQCSVIYLEESAVYLLLHTLSHRHVPLTTRESSQFSFLCSQPQMVVASSRFKLTIPWWLHNNQMLFWCTTQDWKWLFCMIMRAFCFILLTFKNVFSMFKFTFSVPIIHYKFIIYHVSCPQCSAQTWCWATARMCPTGRLSSPTSLGNSPNRMLSRAQSTCCLMCCKAYWGASACLSYTYSDVLCWLHNVGTMPESSHAAAHVRQWRRTACTLLRPSAWPGPTSWTVIVSLQLRKRAATIRCLSSEVMIRSLQEIQ